MKTLIIRVADAPGAQPYPVELYFDDGGQQWQRQPAATGSLSRNPEPVQMRPAAGGRTVQIDQIARFLVETRQSVGYLDIGQHLYDVLHESGIGPTWDSLRATHAAPLGGGLSTVLEVEPASLKPLPWEALSDQQRPLFWDATNPFTRGPIDQTATLEPYLVPLRVLVVVGDPEDATLMCRQEVDAIRAGILQFRGRVEARFLTGPTKDELFAVAENFTPEVFHFIGHGISSPSGLGPALLLKKPGQPREELIGPDIVSRLRTTVGRLAVLNACRTEQVADINERLDRSAQTWSLARRFREAGYHAVIGMQADIPSEASVAFSRTLYEQIAARRPIHVAVAEARRKIGDRRADVGVPSPLLLRDWIVPSLLVSVQPDKVLAERYGDGVTGDTLLRLERSDEFRQIEAFVDRTDMRRDVWSCLETTSQVEARELMLVHGESRLGKTWLLAHGLRTCAWRGKSVRYVSFWKAQDYNVDLLTALRTIRDGSSGSFISQPLPQAARDRLTHDLNFLSRGSRPPVFEFTPGSQPVEDTSVTLEPGELLNAVCGSLIDALEIAASGGPLIVAFDQLETLEQKARERIIEDFLRPVARGEVNQVRVVVALQSGELDRWMPADLIAMAKTVVVSEIQGDFKALATEYVLQLGFDMDRVNPLIEGLSQIIGEGAWRPAMLEPIGRVLALSPVPRRPR